MKKDILLKPHFENYLKHIQSFTCENILEKLEEAEVFDNALDDNMLISLFMKEVKHPELFVSMDTALLKNLLAQLVMTYRFKKVYQFEETITKLLLDTSLKKLDMDFLRSPYPSVYLSLPHNKDLKIYNPQTGDHLVEGIYVYFLEVSDDILNAYPDMPQDIKYVLRYLAVGENKPEFGEDDDAINYGTMFLRDGDIFEQIESEIKRKKEEGFMPYEMDEKIHYSIYCFIINALLYITSAQARLDFYGTQLPNTYSGRNPKKRKRAEKENKMASNLETYCKVGKNIIIKPPSGFTGGGSDEATRKIMARFKVSPHWHSYWTGKGRKKRELRFLAEYVKGKNFDELIGGKTAIVK